MLEQRKTNKGGGIHLKKTSIQDFGKNLGTYSYQKKKNIKIF